ncbi:GNAT family N-acetyltransferase [Pseudoflavitalea sp. G-6-1-2]|uniref:GNAT family N-acetyltransferase n=1 Tax=Pseudoflavitalea sp. G-6-1-2 TaxID=2728841 RepID=UPI00146B93E8|nr:GNAT family N-acetyltransferase [Pseudoflavitalea sp. G-6-1-2]NML21615.1 GNAT family N-acetyltransferase [Pseudoflavitalea sp. G-6-1-2]
MSSSYLFQSSRLGFRRWKSEDLPQLAALNADPAVMEFFPRPYNYEETEAAIARYDTSFEQNGFCFYAVDRLDTGEFIGFIGFSLARFEADFTPCVEIGWRIMRSQWGYGFATEGAARCLQFAFEELQLKVVYSFTAWNNVKSENVMKKIGMRKTAEFLHPALPVGHELQLHLLYLIEAGEFALAHASKK